MNHLDSQNVIEKVMEVNAIQYVVQPVRALNTDRYGDRKVNNGIRVTKGIYKISDKYHVRDLNM
jgi:hypothetical protein